MIPVRTADDASGAYERVERSRRWSASKLRRFTVYAFFADDPASGALDVDALDGVPGAIEEIDVNATDEDDAREIAAAALARDYDPGGRILGAEERFGWYL